MKAKAKDSYMEMFSKLGILTSYSQYLFSTLTFVVKHKDIFTINIELHKINTCQKLDFHVPSVSLKFKEQYIIPVLHHLTPYPSTSRKLHITFINLSMNFRKILMGNSSYSVEEYIDRNNKFHPGVSQ
jgi:hypothetical protein